jgi:NAD(P)-dependent dehydrogenase (short-subunit alcohol dehydrogenase family)
MQLQDRTALITGASRGLGRALAHSLARRGARVVLASRDVAALEDTARTLRATGAQVYALPADVGDKHAVFPLIGAAAGVAGPIDILINNASTLGPTPLRYLLDTECEDLEHVLAVNLVGPFRLIKAVLGSMLLRDYGVVVNITSDAAVEAYPTWGAYGVSKAALDHLTRSFASELMDSHVRVLSVDPGEMDTSMHAAAMPDADPNELARPEQVAERIVSMIEQPDRARPGSRLIAAQWSTP